MITAVVPAYNEEERIEKVLKETSNYVDEIIVVDDFSGDETASIAGKYAKVLKNKRNVGYIDSIKKGFKVAKGDIIVTLDADGEHDPRFIPKLVEPITDGKADLVFGNRNRVPRLSEIFISYLTRLKTGLEDTGTGYRAIKKDLAIKLELEGKCTCGIFALEAFYLGANMTEIQAPERNIKKSRGMAWAHLYQLFVVMRWLLKKKRNRGIGI